MPNIVLDRLACPELIQEDASPEKISEWMALLIEDSNKRQKMLDDLVEVRELLGNPGAVAKTADLVIELLASEKHEKNAQAR